MIIIDAILFLGALILAGVIAFGGYIPSRLVLVLVFISLALHELSDILEHFQ